MVYFGSIGIRGRQRLRWRFDFPDRPTRYGIWNNSGGSQAESAGTSAWCINKTGLVRASIEAEDQEQWTVQTVVECDGWDFVNFRWIAATPIPFDPGGGFQVAGQIIGLAMDTRDNSYSVFIDGSTKITARTEEEKNMNLAGF